MLQQTLLDARKEFRDALDRTSLVLKEQQSQLQQSQNKIDKLEKNPVPLGFIYVQLSSQPDPKTLWPAVTWTDVTAQYAGLFFRAEGSGAAPFGQVQGENAPRLTEARIEEHNKGDADNHKGDGNWYWNHINFNVGGWSSGIGLFAGNRDGDSAFTHHFYMSGGEVRPRNTVIRVWKRTA